MTEHARSAAEEWDQRYTERGERMWSGQPNAALVAEVADMAPGTALDLGCGEGADAIWLAERGWQVTAVDISSVALERGHRAADAAGVEIDWRLFDVTTDVVPGRFDLVSAQYPAFPKTPDDAAIRTTLDAVAAGGTLLYVHHAFDAGHRPEHFDPDDDVQPDDVAGHLDDAWTIEVHERRDRVRPEGSPGPDVPDLILRARRIV